LFLISRDAWLGNFEIRTFNASSRRISTFPVFTAPINHDVASYNPRTPLIRHFAALIAPHEVLLNKDLPAASGFATAAARAVIQQRCRSQRCRLLSGLYQAHTSILLQHPDSKEALLYVNRSSNLKGHDSPRIQPATLRSLSPNRAKSLLQKPNNPFNELLEQSMRCCNEKQVSLISTAMSDVSTRPGFEEQS
jgi:hypothetical protein